MTTSNGDSAEARIRISEIYQSVQGEGLLTGISSIFVRTSGCNLRCWFCDTPYTSWRPEGDYWTVEEIVGELVQYSARHVVLTGGEPLLYPAVESLTRAIRRQGFHLTIETAATLWRDVECDLWSISPKLSSSAPPAQTAGSWHEGHHRRRHRPEVVRRMMQGDYQLKFVVDSPMDAREVLEYLTQIADYDPQRVLLMPQGTDAETLDRRAQWLEPWCQAHGLRFCPRQHIHWFGNRRGT